MRGGFSSENGARFGAFLLAGGAVILAFDPVLWLVRTWVRPEYRSPGAYVFALVVGLFLWSLSSPLAEAPATGGAPKPFAARWKPPSARRSRS